MMRIVLILMSVVSVLTAASHMGIALVFEQPLIRVLPPRLFREIEKTY